MTSPIRNLSVVVGSVREMKVVTPVEDVAPRATETEETTVLTPITLGPSINLYTEELIPEI